MREWILDYNRWRNEFINAGYEVSKFDEDDRFGIHSVNNRNAQQFLDLMSKFKIHQDRLSLELAIRFQTASSWWDVRDLFPILFVDFDRSHVGAFYYEGTPMERYIPNGWTSEFEDFAIDYPENIFPSKNKFWIKGNSNLLEILNLRGSQL